MALVQESAPLYCIDIDAKAQRCVCRCLLYSTTAESADDSSWAVERVAERHRPRCSQTRPIGRSLAEGEKKWKKEEMFAHPSNCTQSEYMRAICEYNAQHTERESWEKKRLFTNFNQVPYLLAVVLLYYIHTHSRLASAPPCSALPLIKLPHCGLYYCYWREQESRFQ